MRKWMAVLLAALLLTGCGSRAGAEQNQMTAESLQPGQVILPVITPERKQYAGITLQVSCPDGTDSLMAEVFSQAAAVFEDRTGGKIRLVFGTAETADIGVLAGSALSAQAGKLTDLTEYAAASNYESHSYPFLRQQVIDRCGSLRAIAWEPELWGIYYNADVFAACGITEMPAIWEDYLALCGILQASGYQALALDEQKAAMATALHLERIFGWDGLKKLGKNDRALQDALQQIVTFLKRGYFSGGWPEDTATLYNRVALRNTAMFAGSDADCTALENAVEMDMNWGVFPWPGTGSGSGCAADSRVLAVMSSCENPQAAFDFILLLTTGEFDQLRADITGRLPADPCNESPVIGGAEALAQAESGLRLLPAGMPLAIWQSRYSSGAKAAEKWNPPR